MGVMRLYGVLVLVAAVAAAGCTPAIPERDAFGTSALVKEGDTPPEFAEFNSYDPSANALLANQICATPYQPLTEKSVGAAPGRLIAARGRCADHVPLIGESVGWEWWQ